MASAWIHTIALRDVSLQDTALASALAYAEGVGWLVDSPRKGWVSVTRAGAFVATPAQPAPAPTTPAPTTATPTAPATAIVFRVVGQRRDDALTTVQAGGHHPGYSKQIQFDAGETSSRDRCHSTKGRIFDILS